MSFLAAKMIDRVKWIDQLFGAIADPSKWKSFSSSDAEMIALAMSDAESQIIIRARGRSLQSGIEKARLFSVCFNIEQKLTRMAARTRRTITIITAVLLPLCLMILNGLLVELTGELRPVVIIPLVVSGSIILATGLGLLISRLDRLSDIDLTREAIRALIADCKDERIFTV